jgi:hypothetical protein
MHHLLSPFVSKGILNTADMFVNKKIAKKCLFLKDLKAFGIPLNLSPGTGVFLNCYPHGKAPVVGWTLRPRENFSPALKIPPVGRVLRAQSGA